jgi:SSS family solute:Na+ symporter
MNLLYPIVLGVIVLVLLSVSLSRLRGTQTKADYLVAGRSLPAIVLVFTLLSSWIGSGSLLGGAENAYKHGMAALWQGGGGWAGLLLIYFIAPRARKFAQFTIPDLLEARYNQTQSPVINSSAAATFSISFFLLRSPRTWGNT